MPAGAIGATWDANSWDATAWDANSWDVLVSAGGAVWTVVNGVSTPPATAVQGSQMNWMCVNGTWVIPGVAMAPRPRRARNER